MIKEDDVEQDDNTFWRKTFFSDNRPAHPLRRTRHDLTAQHPEKIGDAGELWLKQLFQGIPTERNRGDKMRVYKAGAVVYEIPLQKLKSETLIGRHPDADLQLESSRMAMFHAVIQSKGGKFYIENLDDNNGILVKNKKLKLKMPVQLHDGMQIDFPGYRLEFVIANAPEIAADFKLEVEELENIPDFFYKAPPPLPCPVLSNLIEDRGLKKSGAKESSV